MRRLNEYFGLDGWDQYLLFYGYMISCILLVVIGFIF
jgi:hypothetical protein